ncbi:Transposase-like protein (plasmid) [Sinorhizobium meliloti GR4]|nr:Transposase-like protein [Sinorhizobium meliloti GR4]
MNRTGEPSVAELMAQLAANAAEIAALKAEKETLSQRVVKLEEELALARLHRFAPRSEKHVDRIFNEAEEAADEDGADSHESEVIDIPDTGLPPVESTTGQKRGRRPLPQNLPRERVEYDLPDDQKACPCCRGQMHRMGEAVTEQLHIEVKAKVLQNVRFKYACRHCDRTGINTPVVTAPMPVQPLPGSIARQAVSRRARPAFSRSTLKRSLAPKTASHARANFIQQIDAGRQNRICMIVRLQHGSTSSN